jgi:tetratricopeptide (TPR) repeat protein
VDRVRLFLRTGRYEAAEQAAVELLRGATDASSAALAHYLRGLALTSQHYERRAVTALRAAVRLDSGLGMAHFLLAGSLARLGDAAAAADSYRQAAAVLRVRPPDPRSPELDGRDAADLVSLCEVLGRRDGPPR